MSISAPKRESPVDALRREHEHAPMTANSASDQPTALLERALAIVGEGEGDPVWALASINRALVLDPSLATDQVELAQALLLLHQGRLRESHTHLERVHTRNPAAFSDDRFGFDLKRVYVDVLLRCAQRFGDGDAARRATEEARALGAQNLVDDAESLMQVLPWSGALQDLLPKGTAGAATALQSPISVQPILNDTMPDVGHPATTALLERVADEVMGPLQRQHLPAAIAAATTFLMNRQRWARNPKGALQASTEADFLALALLGHALAATQEFESAHACLRAVVAQAPFRKLFLRGTDHIITFSGARLTYLEETEARELAAAKHHSLAKLSTLLGKADRRSSWWRFWGSGKSS